MPKIHEGKISGLFTHLFYVFKLRLIMPALYQKSTESGSMNCTPFFGIEYYVGTAVGLRLQKFWNSFADVKIVMTLRYLYASTLCTILSHLYEGRYSDGMSVWMYTMEKRLVATCCGLG